MAYDCENCTYNQGFSAWPETRLPCGQFNCWIELERRGDEGEEE